MRSPDLARSTLIFDSAALVPLAVGVPAVVADTTPDGIRAPVWIRALALSIPGSLLTAVASPSFGVEAVRRSPRELLGWLGVAPGATPWAIARTAVVVARH